MREGLGGIQGLVQHVTWHLCAASTFSSCFSSCCPWQGPGLSSRGSLYHTEALVSHLGCYPPWPLSLSWLQHLSCV